MSLNWDITKVANRDKIDSEHKRGVLDALIWSTMSVGMGEISADPESKYFYKRFAARLDFVQKLCGPFLNTKDGPRFLNEEDVERFIGLRTNVSYETPHFFLNRFTKIEKEKF